MWEHNSLIDLINKELKTTITTTNITTTTIAPIIDKLGKTKEVSDNLKTTSENLKEALYPIYFFIFTLLSIICHCLRKCYMNNGDCKVGVKE